MTISNTIELNGFKIEIWFDESGENPIEAWDGFYPMRVQGHRTDERYLGEPDKTHNVYKTTVRGHSQSDWYNVTVYGDSEASQECMKAQAELFASWVFGNVYGYTISEGKTCECCEHTAWEIVDSCGGFYGSDHEVSGLMEAVQETIPEFKL